MTTKTNARAIANAGRRQLEHDAGSALPEFLTAVDLEALTGTRASTWRYWAHIQSGPTSFKLGRRRVWRRSVVLAWLEAQEGVG